MDSNQDPPCTWPTPFGVRSQSSYEILFFLFFFIIRWNLLHQTYLWLFAHQSFQPLMIQKVVCEWKFWTGVLGGQLQRCSGQYLEDRGEVERVLQQMFPVHPLGRLQDGIGRGLRKALNDTEEGIGDLSYALSHTSLFRHVSVSARSIWWPSAPADLPCAFKPGTASAVPALAHQHDSFPPLPPAKWAGTTGMNENLVNKQTLLMSTWNLMSARQ